MTPELLPRRAALSPATGRRVRLLLLEADLARRHVVREAAADWEPLLEWQEVEDANQFSIALASFRCDLVLVGMGLNDFGELRALDQVKREWPDLPTLIIATAPGEDAAVEALQRGASDYLLYHRLQRLPAALARALKDREERAGRRRAGEALEFSARASAELATSLDFATTAERVTRLAVPFLAGYCAVDVLEEGHVRRRAECALDNFPPALFRDLGTLAALPDDTFWAGRPLALPLLPGTDAPHGEDTRALLEDGLSSLLRLPLRTQGRALGILTLAVAKPTPPLTVRVLPLAEDFAHRASLALDAARLHGQLQRSDQRKDEFLAMLAHELRNPLASILAALELHRVRGSDAPLDRSLESAQRQAKHMARILDDLLDISRITRGKIELRRQPTELNELVQQVLLAARSRVESRGLSVHVDAWPEPLPVLADPDRVEQVLTNLLSNAAKFTRPGGRVWVTTSREGVEAVMRVRDSGLGIEPEMLPRIFDLFVQANPSLDRAEGGLGLGLTLVRQLTELHGGSVSVASDGPGRGSEFTVRLPLSVGMSVPPRSRAAPKPEPTRHLRVLLVDDNQDLRESTGELLRILEHDVVEASDGHEAVRRAQGEAFDVALVDLGLPGLNGYAVAQALRGMEQDSGHRTALVALTGYGQPEHRRRTLQAGFDEHLTKPLDFEQLRDVLTRVAPKRNEELDAPEHWIDSM
jgi:signal transduction histidine kinase/DNA-binding response OmpR family regulator